MNQIEQTNPLSSGSVWALILIFGTIAVGALCLLYRWLRSLDRNRRTAAEPASVAASGNSQAERERVLKLLEDGRITPEECSELLNALSHAASAKVAQSIFATPYRKLVLAGLGLVLIGFFLPWFTINIGKELGQSMGQAVSSMNQFMPQNFRAPAGFKFNFDTGSTSIAGVDIGRGLGWCVLLLGTLPALLLWVVTGMDQQTRYKAALCALAAGSFFILYIMDGALRFVSPGIFVVIAGYILQFVGTYKDRLPTAQ